MLCLQEIIDENQCKIQEKKQKVENSVTLYNLVLAVFSLVKFIGCRIIEKELQRRNTKKCNWPKCLECQKKLESRGNEKRTVLTLLGKIEFKRKVGRCKNCGGSYLALLDISLGISPRQRTSNELRQIACLLSVFVPFETSSKILEIVAKLSIPAKTIYNWCQHFGSLAYNENQWELHCQEQGLKGFQESISEDILSLPLVIGGDGVMVPFRPNEGNAKGSIVWKEVKVGVFSRIKTSVNKQGEKISKLVQRRLVAVLGNIELFQKHMQLEAYKQRVSKSKVTAWISDGGRGFWKLFENYFSKFSIGILDFYHGVQYLWRFAKTCLDGRTNAAKTWFNQARKDFRKGDITSIMFPLEKQEIIEKYGSKSPQIRAYQNINDYLLYHVEHINYAHFQSLGLPIGSGMVESACKWLIQQRFKCVGMRWSEKGFNHLLQLRVAWINNRFDRLFY